ncbi:MAG: ACT domain-containing protein [Clostridia bacterium]|nr:ACT domain-containing protein [Clostridia bacterium]MBR4087058.1 ACT domain-containing protein [Clostridia bacterium]
MKAVISVIGKDKVGIIARISKICAENNVNINDITQKVLHDTFTMIMWVEMEASEKDFTTIAKELEAAGEEMGLIIHVMHEDVFDSMHRI